MNHFAVYLKLTHIEINYIFFKNCMPTQEGEIEALWDYLLDQPQ